jgi:hypothetical protein
MSSDVSTNVDIVQPTPRTRATTQATRRMERTG